MIACLFVRIDEEFWVAFLACVRVGPSHPARDVKFSRSVSWSKITTLERLFAAGGKSYVVQIEGEQRTDGTWGGRVVFVDGKNIRRTTQETSQPDRKALEYWATGLEPVYLEGAFDRARQEKS